MRHSNTALLDLNNELYKRAQESDSEIGRVAKNLYSELGRFGLTQFGVSSILTHDQSTSYDRFYIETRTDIAEYAADATGVTVFDMKNPGPRLHPIEGVPDIFAVGAETEIKREYAGVMLNGRNGRFYRSIPLPKFPGFDRKVKLLVMGPDAKKLWNRNPAISSSGWANTIYDSPMKNFTRFTDADRLARYHTIGYMSNLALAGLVAHGIGLVYGIKSDLSTLEELHASWRQVADIEEIPTTLPFWAQDGHKLAEVRRALRDGNKG